MGGEEAFEDRGFPGARRSGYDDWSVQLGCWEKMFSERLYSKEPGSLSWVRYLREPSWKTAGFGSFSYKK